MANEFKPSVLIVDDDEIVRTALMGILRAKCNSSAVKSAAEALKFLEGSEPHVIISDINMPDMDGFELLKKVKENHPYLPIIIITADSHKDLAIKALRTGAFDYLQKPVTAKELLFSVERAVKHRMLEFEKEVLMRRLKKAPGRSSDPTTAELKKILGEIHQLCADTLNNISRPSVSVEDFKNTVKTLLNLSSPRY